ncbi:MAG: carboxymuconolactone decarboxylase family protein [Candidatus Krumholzibacteria bacterium]|nr:carboxymuconolactone decarboxylase family protein [Candidatus Krumholzibacteria bacterium]
MSGTIDEAKSLSQGERELTAIGAAIASNCIPCIQYHIPRARQAGLSDSQICEAVVLADKVRRVPAGMVLQTAYARVEPEKPVRPTEEPSPCGCSEAQEHREESAGCGTETLEADRVQLDNQVSKEDNEMKKSCKDRTRGKTDPRQSGNTSEEQENVADQTGFDCLKMMEMMSQCCPDRMKDLSSMMANFTDGCCPAKEEIGSKKPGSTKPVA